MKILKSRIYIGTIYKSFNRLTKNSVDDDANNFGRDTVQEKAFLVKFGQDSYVPVNAIKNNLHFFVLEQKIQMNGTTKYAPEFLHTATDIETKKFVGNIKPAFSNETSHKNIGFSTLKKFVRIMESSEKTMENI